MAADATARPSHPPDLAPLGERLARFGVTGVTDATPSDHLSSIELLGRAVVDGALPQEVTVTGSPLLAGAPRVEGVRWGPVKVVIADHDLPALEDLRHAYRAAHEAARPVAVHCVTPVALALALAAWDEAGVRRGDRIEHGSVITPEAAARVAELGLVVVTQPGFVASRGDLYLEEVEAALLPHLYPCASLLARGIGVGGSTDAPYGRLDPWEAMAAAAERRTGSGALLNGDERVPAQRALELFLTRPDDPGGRRRRRAPGRGGEPVPPRCAPGRGVGPAGERPCRRHGHRGPGRVPALSRPCVARCGPVGVSGPARRSAPRCTRYSSA